MSGLVYLVQVNIYLLAFYAFYRLLLSKETFFNLNRFYLIGSTLASFAIPVFQADWIKNLLATQKVQEVALSLNSQAYEVLFQPRAEIKVLSLGEVLIWVYFAVAGTLFIKLLYQIYQAIKAFRNQHSLEACSFFGYVAVDEDMEGKEAIMNHELVHVNQYHSADVIFFELTAIINWFNPIVYFLKKEIKKNHEYIADEQASETLAEKSAYAMLIFNQNFGIQAQNITNSFFNQSILKQRIMMLQKNKSKRSALLKYGLSAPLFLAMLILSSAFVSEKTQGTTQGLLETKVLTDTITVPPPPPFAPSKTPLYFVDGKLNEAEAFNKIDPKTIKSMNVLDGKQAKKKYGKKGTNGAIEIVLKKVAAVSPTKNTPLYVLDGKVMDADIQSLNPDEIQSINVLKGEKATEKYGEKGVNGVIEITSKKAAVTTNSDEMIGDKSAEAKSLDKIDTMPQFAGGQAGWAKFLQENVKYPKEAHKNNISGRVILSFVVEKSGELSEIKVLKSVEESLDQEALRVIKNSPKWIPGMKDGKAVRVSFTMPINFALAAKTK